MKTESLGLICLLMATSAVGQELFPQQRSNFSIAYNSEFDRSHSQGVSFNYYHSFSERRRFFVGLELTLGANKKQMDTKTPGGAVADGECNTFASYLGLNQRFVLWTRQRFTLYFDMGVSYRNVFSDASLSYEVYIPERYVWGSWIGGYNTTRSSGADLDNGCVAAHAGVTYFVSIFHNHRYNKGIFVKPSVRFGKKLRVIDDRSLQLSTDMELNYSIRTIAGVFPYLAVGIML